MSTIFGKIIRGELGADVLFDDERVMAFRDIKPAAPTHFLVIPKREIKNLAEMTAEDVELVGYCLKVCADVAKRQGLEHYRVVTNNGSRAGQSVFHLHFHVLGGRDLGWPPG